MKVLIEENAKITRKILIESFSLKDIGFNKNIKLSLNSNIKIKEKNKEKK